MKIIQNRGMGVLLVKRAEDGSDVWGFLVELLRQRLQQHLTRHRLARQNLLLRLARPLDLVCAHQHTRNCSNWKILNILNHLKMNAKLNQQICFQKANIDPNHGWLTIDCAKWIPRNGKECCVGHSAFTVSVICPSAGGKGRILMIWWSIWWSILDVLWSILSI